MHGLIRDVYRYVNTILLALWSPGQRIVLLLYLCYHGDFDIAVEMYYCFLYHNMCRCACVSSVREMAFCGLCFLSAEILDDSGVTPAHFAAQRGHLDCLQVSGGFYVTYTHLNLLALTPFTWRACLNSLHLAYLP